MPNRKAVLVGMNHYPNPRNELPSCENDAHRFHDLLTSQYGFAPEDCRIIVSQPPDVNPTPANNDASKQNILNHLKWLFSGVTSGDRLVLYYSGHGYRTTTADGVLRDCICLYDDFLFGNEFSQLTTALPNGCLTVVLDSCFSGGMDKTYFVAFDGASAADEAGVVRNKFFWADADQASKDFQDQLRPLPYQPFGGSIIHPARPLLVEEATKGFQREKAFVAVGATPAVTPDEVVDKDLDQQLNGLLISACNAEEKAAASTPATNGLSAFTFCLLGAWSDMHKTADLDRMAASELHAAAGTRLRALNLPQTPLIKEPPAPAGLASRSFVTLSAIGAAVTAGSTQPTTTTASSSTPPQGGGTASLQDLVQMVLSQFGKAETTPSSKGFTDVSTTTSPTAVALGGMPAIDDKGFWDVFNSIAPVALQLVGSLTKEYEAGGKAMNVQTVSVDIPSSADKGFWDYFNTIAPVALQVIGSLTGGKAFESNGSSGAASVTPSAAASGTLSVNDKGFWDVFNKVAPTVLHIVGQLTKSYDPGSKSFSTAASKAVVTIDDIPPASDKGFWDVVSSVARVAVPLIVSAL